MDAFARCYFKALLRSNVRISRHEKGMIHSKNMVVDGQVSIVGAANLDIRGVELDFEVNAIVYDEEIEEQLKKA